MRAQENEVKEEMEKQIEDLKNQIEAFEAATNTNSDEVRFYSCGTKGENDWILGVKF